MSPYLCCLCPGLLLAAGSSLAMATVNPAITLATYDYPPYCDSSERDGGALVAIVRAAFAEEDVSVNLTVLPWQRLSSLSADGRFDGVIGVWKTDSNSLRVSMGPPVFYSILGFYQRESSKPFTAQDLHGRQAGVVSGYHYPTSLRRLGTGFDAARDDETNLRKLQQGRIDIAITEKAVGEALIRKRRVPASPALSWNGRILGREALSVGFYQGTMQQHWQQVFQRGLKQLIQSGQHQQIVARYGLQEYVIARPPLARHTPPRAGQ